MGQLKYPSRFLEYLEKKITSILTLISQFFDRYFTITDVIFDTFTHRWDQLFSLTVKTSALIITTE